MRDSFTLLGEDSDELQAIGLTELYFNVKYVIQSPSSRKKSIKFESEQILVQLRE